MRGVAHLSISALLCQCFALLVFKDFTPIPLLIGAIFGLIADIDEDQSKISYMLVGKLGGPKRIGGVNHHKTDVKYNSRIKKIRQIAITLVVLFIGFILYILSKKNIFFLLGCMYISILPWTKHRSLSHSILSSLVVGTCAYLGFKTYGLSKYGIYCGIGYFLHVFEDFFTVSGVPLFYPISKKRFKVPLMSTGTKKGSIVEFAFMVISFCLCVITYFSYVVPKAAPTIKNIFESYMSF